MRPHTTPGPPGTRHTAFTGGNKGNGKGIRAIGKSVNDKRTPQKKAATSFNTLKCALGLRPRVLGACAELICR